MAILPRAGRAAIAESIKAQPIHLAWGLGNGSWTTPPAESANATGLINEIGRRTATSVEFVTPDVDGDIEIANVGKFSISVEPTNNLYVYTRFDFADATSAIIREIGVFVGSTMIGGLPLGQKYFVPAEVDDPGIILQLENRAPIYRSAGTREAFEVLVIF